MLIKMVKKQSVIFHIFIKAFKSSVPESWNSDHGGSPCFPAHFIVNLFGTFVGGSFPQGIIILEVNSKITVT